LNYHFTAALRQTNPVCRTDHVAALIQIKFRAHWRRSYEADCAALTAIWTEPISRLWRQQSHRSRLWGWRWCSWRVFWKPHRNPRLASGHLVNGIRSARVRCEWFGELSQTQWAQKHAV